MSMKIHTTQPAEGILPARDSKGNRITVSGNNAIRFVVSDSGSPMIEEGR
jgi:hypothetical protein